MLVARLYEIVTSLEQEYDRTKIGDLLERLSNALETSMNSPSVENAQVVSSLRDEISKALSKSAFNDVPVTMMRELEELNLWEWTGNRLLESIGLAFQGNDITLAKAKEELDSIRETLQTDINNVKGAANSISYFNVDSADLEPGHFEIGVAIPREAVHNEMRGLGAELVKLDKIFGVFSEIYTGERSNFRLISISTSDPTVFVESAPAVAAAVALAIERSVALYNQILSIRKAHQELSAQKVPKKILDGLTEHIQKSIKDGLAAHAEQVRKEDMKAVESARQNELVTELSAALWAIAKRLDEGYLFDVRGEPEKPTTDENGAPQPPKNADKLAIVQRAAKTIQKFTPEVEPILLISDDMLDRGSETEEKKSPT